MHARDLKNIRRDDFKIPAVLQSCELKLWNCEMLVDL